MSNLNGRTALVTGARRGIGRAICLALANAGADVAVNDITGGSELESVATDITKRGRRAITHVADVADADAVKNMVSEVSSKLGPIDILVNNAGVESIIPFLEISSEEWDRVTRINLKGEFLCAQSVAAAMVERKAPGAIINIGSVQSGLVLPGRTHYAPSKRAIEALTANMAVELAPHNIRVNAIHPGLVDTDMTAWVMKDREILPIVLEKIAMKRAGDPSEIAKVVVFLASDEASYVTGQSLYVDGGFQIQ